MRNLNPIYESGNPFPDLDLGLVKLPDQYSFNTPNNQNAVQYGPLIKNANPAVSSNAPFIAGGRAMTDSNGPIPGVTPVNNIDTNSVQTTQSSDNTPVLVKNNPSNQQPSGNNTNTSQKTLNKGSGSNNSNSSSGMTPWQMVGSVYAGTVGTGIASKFGKDMLLTHKIMERYPEPKDLASSLQHMDSDYAHQVAAKLYQAKTRNEYKTIIKRYVLKTGGLFKYLMHGALGPFTTYHNIKDMNRDVVDVIGRHVR